MKEHAGRIGLAARGAVYCVLGLLAVQVATGSHDRKLDRQGALRVVARQPGGAVLLAALAVGFAGYAGWRLHDALTSGDGWPKRLLHAGRGLLYAGFTWTAVQLLVTRRAGRSSDAEAKTWSARLMSQPAGRWLVALIGVAFLATGAGLAWRGVRQKFRHHLRLARMRGWQRRWLPRLGTVGQLARAAVAALVGAFLVQAALRFDPREAVGVDGALHQLARRPYGGVLLLAVAAGLVAYGLFSFVEARWRELDSGH